jgi:hypothetical protein
MEKKGSLTGKRFEAKDRVLQDVGNAGGVPGDRFKGDAEGVLLILAADVNEPRPASLVPEAVIGATNIAQGGYLFHDAS